MAVRVGINHFGRIGRQSLKALIERMPAVEVVAVNDLVDTSMNALHFKHDSTYGAYAGTVDHTEDAVIVDGREIKVFKEPIRLRCRGATSASTRIATTMCGTTSSATPRARRTALSAPSRSSTTS